MDEYKGYRIFSLKLVHWLTACSQFRTKGERNAQDFLVFACKILISHFEAPCVHIVPFEGFIAAQCKGNFFMAVTRQLIFAQPVCALSE